MARFAVKYGKSGLFLREKIRSQKGAPKSVPLCVNPATPTPDALNFGASGFFYAKNSDEIFRDRSRGRFYEPNDRSSKTVALNHR